MGLTDFPNGVTSFGMPLVGSSSDYTTTGNVFFVDSGSTARGDVADKGTSPDTPFSTIDFAVGRCTASNGDIIFVMPGHAEDISSATSLVSDVIGVRIIGMGWGRTRPVLTYTNTAGTVEMDAASCTLENIVFFASVSAVVVGINMDAADCSVINCEFDFDATGDDFITGIDIDAVDRAAIINCRFIAEETTGMAEAIRLATANECRVIGNQFTGHFTNSCIQMESVISNSVEIRDNYMWNGHANARGVLNSTGYSGIFDNNTHSIESVVGGHDRQVLDSVSGATLNWQLSAHRSSVFDGGTTNSHGDLSGTNDPYTIFTVTGDVIIKALWGVVNTTLTGATATISVGVVGNTAGIIALETGTELLDGNIYVSATDAVGVSAVANTGLFAINDGLDVIETPLTANVTGGQIDYYCIWAPAEDGASIISAAATT